MNYLLSLTTAQLRHATSLKEKIVDLKQELAATLAFNAPVAAKRGPGRPKQTPTAETIAAPQGKRRRMSAAARARMATTTKARWAMAKTAGRTLS
jgi:hypothetical protein